jgi:hypothetical protein
LPLRQPERVRPRESSEEGQWGRLAPAKRSARTVLAARGARLDGEAKILGIRLSFNSWNTEGKFITR